MTVQGLHVKTNLVTLPQTVLSRQHAWNASKDVTETLISSARLQTSTFFVTLVPPSLALVTGLDSGIAVQSGLSTKGRVVVVGSFLNNKPTY